MATTAKPRVALERALSKLGLASRSQARELITQGRVAIDGAVSRDPLLRVIPERAHITIDGHSSVKAAARTIALHKPRGYVTTRSDPEGRKTVYELLTGIDERLVAVGRLDLATSGLLLFTNDTQMANWLTDPRSAVPRIYLVTVDGRLDESDVDRLLHGVVDDGERLAAAAINVRKTSNRESHVTLTLTEGKNREIRRLFEAIGHPVTQLRRVQFGGLELGSLEPGKWRDIPATELRSAFPGYSPRIKRKNPASSRRLGRSRAGTSKSR